MFTVFYDLSSAYPKGFCGFRLVPTFLTETTVKEERDVREIVYLAILMLLVTTELIIHIGKACSRARKAGAISVVAFEGEKELQIAADGYAPLHHEEEQQPMVEEQCLLTSKDGDLTNEILCNRPNDVVNS